MRLRKAASLAAAVVLSTGLVAAVGQSAAAATGESAVSSARSRLPARPEPPARLPPDRLPTNAPPPTPSGPRIPHLDPALQRPGRPASELVHVRIRGVAAQAVDAVRHAGGRVLAQVAGEVSATVPRSALTALAGSAGVSDVAPAVEAVPDAVSEGVAKSGASTWLNATPATTGAGVTVAIVDTGFGNLSAEVAAGALPAGTTVSPLNNGCSNVNNTEHGTAVAEIVHQMAPSAKLQLYCIGDTTGFRQAEQDIVSRGIPIVNSSLSFPGDSRGDGSGDATSAAATVQAARKAGVLWIASAGNNGQDHWSGTFADSDRDGYTDLNGTTSTNESDAVVVPPGQSGTAYLSWDQWPQSSAPVTLVATPYKCDPSGCQTSLVLTACPVGNSCSVAQPSGSRPVLSLNLPNNTTSNNFEWVIQVKQGSGTPAVRYDLTYYRDVGPSLLSVSNSSRAAAGSVDSPASSPYALAVGAANVSNNSLEPYSSQGPTIDRRVKPDITGFDNVSTSLDQFSSFSGTSAGAPHVAGAAALIKSANSNLDAAQLQAQLESRATGIAAGAPPTNQLGHGLLALGSRPPVTAPAGNSYLPLSTPSKVFDSRTRSGGRPLGTGEQVSVALTGAPAGATAVALNLGGIGATGSTYLTVFPSTYPGTSTLSLSQADSPATVFTIVQIGPNNTIQLRNATAPTHAFIVVLGYFAPTGTLGYTATNPARILNTQQSPGTRVAAGATVTVTAPTSVPSSAKALAVNVMAFSETGAGYLTLSPDGSNATATLNYSSARTRANSNIVVLNSSRQFKIFNGGSATHVIVDLVGYLTTSTAGRFVPLTPVRIVDTSSGNGGRYGPLGAAGTMTVTGSGIDQVPYPAAALMVGVLPVPSASTPDSYLTIYPSSPRPGTSSVAFSGGRLVSNGVIMNLAAGQNSLAETSQVYNSAGTVDIIMDLFGYFLR
jgi:subtilisin family serine protease